MVIHPKSISIIDEIQKNPGNQLPDPDFVENPEENRRIYKKRDRDRRDRISSKTVRKTDEFQKNVASIYGILASEFV